MVRLVIVNYKLLPFCKTINSVPYCEELKSLRQAIERKQTKVIDRKYAVSTMTMLYGTYF